MDEAYFASLEGGFSAYLARLSGNARRSIFHRRQYLESIGKVTMEVARPSENTASFQLLNCLHELRWGQPVFLGQRLAFHEDLATRLAGEDRLRFYRLSVDGRIVSVLYHLRGGRHEYNLQMGFDDRFHGSKISLGLLHLGYAIERASYEGMELVDLLAGYGKQRPFKQRVAPEKERFLRRQYLRSAKARAVFGGRHAIRSVIRLGTLRSRDES